MLEICANNIHLMLIKNEQKYVNSLYISRKELKTVHKKIKAICLNIIHYLIMFHCLFKKRHPRLRCFKTERDAFLNIYISSIPMSIPKHYINMIIIYLYSDNHEV